jgi:hypothetical protein
MNMVKVNYRGLLLQYFFPEPSLRIAPREKIPPHKSVLRVRDVFRTREYFKIVSSKFFVHCLSYKTKVDSFFVGASWYK